MEKKSNYRQLQDTAWANAAKKKKSKSFSHLKSELNFHKKTCAFDVSSSGLQIMSGLTGYLPGLVETNLIIRVGGSLEKQDFYTSFYSHLINILKKNSVETILPEVLTEILKISRADIKVVLIAFLYSQGRHQRTLNLIKLIDWPIIKTVKSEDHKHRYQQMKILATIIDTEFAHLYVDVSSLKILLEKNLPTDNSIRQKKGIFLFLSPERTQSFYSCIKSETSEFHSRRSNGCISSYKHQYFDDKFDAIGCEHSICPNFIHRVDAEILSEVIIFAKKNDIILTPSHDSFLLDEKYESIIKKCYFNSFITCTLKSNFLENFISENSAPVFKDAEKILSNFKKNKTKILEKLESGEYIMSDSILTP
jgi:hypothetical protein